MTAMRFVFGFVIASIAMTSSGVCDEAIPPKDSSVPPVRCAANAVYLTLRLCGDEVEFDRVHQLLPDRPNGCSLLEVKEAFQEFGHDAVVEKWTVEDLPNLNFPVIAHLDSGEGTSLAGHFVVIRSIEDDRLNLIDGTTGNFDSVTMDWFDEQASGNIVRLQKSSIFPRLGIAAIGLGVIVVISLSTSKSKKA